MKVIGIICEYNPLHLGHKKQLDQIRQEFGPDAVIVCLMSGHFVQRGAPAILDKSLRAKAAIQCGADLVLELPVTCALSSAEGFAAGGVRILSRLCDTLCFGMETPDRDGLLRTAQALLSPEFSPILRQELDNGHSFPAARAAALDRMGTSDGLLTQPNDILATEYCKAILSQNSPMAIFPIHRQGSYHADIPDADNPSATAVRNLMLFSHNWQYCVPSQVRPLFEQASLHALSAGERAMLAKLRTMTDGEFEALPYGSEGLWRKFMHACRKETSLEQILSATKSKRYTRSRLNRMAMCAFLGITQEMLSETPPHTRILAFSDSGRKLLSRHKEDPYFINIGQKTDDPYWELEKRCSDLYGLFCTDGIEPPGQEEKRRIYYKSSGDAV